MAPVATVDPYRTHVRPRASLCPSSGPRASLWRRFVFVLGFDGRLRGWYQRSLRECRRRHELELSDDEARFLAFCGDTTEQYEAGPEWEAIVAQAQPLCGRGLLDEQAFWQDGQSRRRYVLTDKGRRALQARFLDEREHREDWGPPVVVRRLFADGSRSDW